MKAPPEAPPPLPAALAALTGQGVAAIDTPAAVIDLDAMERNLAAHGRISPPHGLRLRPHAKMHKSASSRTAAAAGRRRRPVRADRGEAEALAAGGVNDIYISNEVLAAAKLRRVAALAQQLQAAAASWPLRWTAARASQRLAQAFEALAAGTMRR
jgi:3-hydroxy-D-aspartate aldolase